MLKSSYKQGIYIDKNGVNLLKKCSPWTVKIFRIISIPFARLLSKTNIHPNVITLLTIPFACTAAFFFFKNMLVYGAFFFFISFLLDCTDGDLARFTNKKSDFGGKLDRYTDKINNFAMYFGLWYSQYYQTGFGIAGGSIFAAHYLLMFFGTLFILNYKYKTVFKSVMSYYMPIDQSIIALFVLPILGLFFYLFPILVITQFISHIVLVIKQKRR